ncbi:Flp family type IVb pilin [Mesorhizobium sp. NPDC059025]
MIKSDDGPASCAFVQDKSGATAIRYSLIATLIAFSIIGGQLHSAIN